MEEFITIEKKKLQQLLSNFYELCSMCDELDIYEHDELDNIMQEMKKFADNNFNLIK